MKKKIVEIAHDFLKPVLNETCIGVDFTCGQGFDTLFLPTHCLRTYAFDIQEEAVKLTCQLCEQASLRNVEVILDSHEQVKKYVTSFKAGIFNCGYLPHGKQSVTTQGEVVLRALSDAL